MFRNVCAISDHTQSENFTTISCFLEVFAIPFTSVDSTWQEGALIQAPVLQALLWFSLEARNPGAMGRIHLESGPQPLLTSLLGIRDLAIPCPKGPGPTSRACIGSKPLEGRLHPPATDSSASGVAKGSDL